MSRKRGKNYEPKIAEEILELAREGKTNAQIAEALGLSTRTIEKWTTEKAELIQAIKLAKEPTDNTVEATLLQKALGYQKEVIKLFFDPKSLQVIEHKYIEFVEPDTTSIIFWLKNRRPDKWLEAKHIKIDNPADESKSKAISDLGSKMIQAIEKWNG